MISCENLKMSPPTVFLVVSHLPIFIACLPNDYLRNFPLDYWRMTFAPVDQGRDSLCASLLGSNGVWGWAGSEWISAPSIECTLVKSLEGHSALALGPYGWDSITWYWSHQFLVDFAGQLVWFFFQVRDGSSNVQTQKLLLFSHTQVDPSQ